MKLRKAGSLGPIVGFDLESRPLAFWYEGKTTAEITALAWKTIGERRTHSLMLCDNGLFEDDDGYTWGQQEACGQFAEVLASAGLVFGHNIRKFDLPLFNAALFRAGLDTLGPLLTTDTLRDAPRTSDMSRSLASLADQLALKGKKHAMSPAAWEDANRLTPEGVTQARVRVTSDVLLQERLRAALLERGYLGPPKVWRP